MPQVYRCALLVLIAVSVSVLSLAQSAASAAASAIVAQPAPAAKLAAPKKPATEKGTKHFVDVYSLPDHAVPIISTKSPSCYAGPLTFASNNATEVAKILPSDLGFTLTAIPPDKIAIFSAAVSPSATDLQKLKDHMKSLASSDFSKAEAIRVPAGSADKSIAQLTLPPDGSIVVRAVGENCVLIVSKSQADPVAVAAITESIPGQYWRQPSAPPTQRLFYVDATAVAKKLTSPDDSKTDSTGTDKTASKSKDPTSSAGDKTAGGTVSPTVSISVTSGGSSQSAKATPSGDGADSPDSSHDDPSNSDTTDSASKKAGGKPSSPDKTKTTPPPPPKPPAMQPVNDMLVYSNEDGSDRGIFERNRLMAVLDLPRPEVLMNVWSLQVSTRDPATASLEAESAGELVSHHNEALENAIEQGWEFLSRKMVEPNFFEPRFYEYVTQKFAEHQEDSEKQGEAEPEQTDKIGAANRKRWGWCDPDQYCLGFIHAFEPVRPTLTNILLALISADKSETMAVGTIDIMQCPSRHFEGSTLSCNPYAEPDKSCKPGPKSKDACADNTAVDRFDTCANHELKRLYTLKQQSAMGDCELDDRINLLTQINSHQQEGLQLHCFREQAKDSFGPDATPAGIYPYAATRVGLLRAAVADFLFNYKWATQYPHDFIPYDLTQSAQELNAEFNPLVLAFNRDVKAFAQNLQTELQCKHEANAPRLHPLAWFKKSDETFLNEGMISVRGISGVESVVDTVTQSFFDATKPPSLTDLVKSVSDAEKNIPGVLQTNLTANEAAVLLGALNSVQPAEAKIGRELKLDITPHALAGASAAELEVKLTADETANPTLFKADKQEEDTLSRVAKHETNTRVRVESLKLFDVSAFSAMLQRPRSKFPIVPPFFEVPYFGSFIGWPLAGTKVYHRSTAIVSAIIVPTAADLAFGIEFSSDRICQAATDSQRLGCHSAHSPYDFGSLPLRNFHKAMVQCFASGGSTPYTGLRTHGDLSQAKKACDHLALFQFKSVPEQVGAPADNTVPPPN